MKHTSAKLRKYLLLEYIPQNEIKLFISMLGRTVWIRSPHSTREILQSSYVYFKTNIHWRFIVYAVEIIPSEVTWLPVKVKGIQHMRVLRNYFNFVFVKRKIYEDHNLFLR